MQQIQGVQKRKTRHFLRKVMAFFGIFILTFLFCWIVWLSHFLIRQPLISPLAQQSSSQLAQTGKDASLLQVVKNFCSSQKISYKSVVLQNGVITLTLQNDAIVLLSTQKDIEKQLSSLQLAMNQLTIEGKQFTKLDFRFDKPVISF